MGPITASDSTDLHFIHAFVMATDSTCLFCRIAAGDLPSERCFESDDVVAFRDIDPQAPTHILVIPREHITSLAEVPADRAELVGRLHLVAAQLARDEGLVNGWRTVFNVGDEGGQSVDHLHLHLLGGRAMTWPPG